jgi:putative metallohydrolase (TIGR04338 family)
MSAGAKAPTGVETQSVYAAEDAVAAWCRAVRADGSVEAVDRFGVEHTYRPEPLVRFGDVADVAPYLDKVMAHLRAGEADFGGRQHEVVGVRARRGAVKAVYELASATIAVPTREAGGAWALTELVVLHELAHHLDGGQSHGAEFRLTFLRLLEALGKPEVARMLHDAYTGAGLGIGPDRSPATGSESLLTRIGKLLRQAERAGTTAEAEAFLAKAQSMAATNSVSLAVARAGARRGERREAPTFTTVRIGNPGERSNRQLAELLIVLARANRLEILIHGNGFQVELHGFPTDIAVVEALYASLSIQMVEAANRFLASGAHREESVETWDSRRRRWVDKPVHGTTARIAFYSGFRQRIADRLGEVIADAEREAIEAERRMRPVSAPGSTDLGQTSTELALVAKSVELHDHFAAEVRRRGIRRSWGGASDGGDAHASRRAGDRAGTRASLGERNALPGA